MAFSVLRRCTARPKSRLICLPPGGASVRVLARFGALRGTRDVEVLGYRASTTRLGGYFAPEEQGDLGTVVDRIARDLEGLDPLPYVLLGCSMGATIAFETALRVERFVPAHVILVSAGWPGRGDRTMHDASDTELRSLIARAGGTPLSLLEDAEFMAVALSLFRRDIRAFEAHEIGAASRLAVPVSIFYGEDDELVTARDVDQWKARCTRVSRAQGFLGGHFFFDRGEIDHLVVSELCALGEP